ncbi:hypothetical protein [Chitinophaga varians]|uniref:hypothetical protein n=1 Tax=Chitinophaga varians TaxID=2202339 RepID=UPI00165FE40E|nr:hypothetical protein [Chitinophaga varians]MBC9913190.1 hypothetical protein [Chitinophaga varians]
MAYPTGQYFIDGMDLWVVFSIIVAAGSDDLLKLPARKDSISHDWLDENGTDVDLSRVFFESREINLECGMIANDEADFHNKFTAFKAVIAQPQLRRLESSELSSSFFVYYKDCSSFVRATRIKAGPNAGKVAAKFTLVLVEKSPTIDSSNVFMITDDNRLMIT